MTDIEMFMADDTAGIFFCICMLILCVAFLVSVLKDDFELGGQKMKKNILVKVGEKTETRIRTIPAEYSETGDLIHDAYDETYTVTVPVMEAQNVEMTDEEIAEMQRMAAEMPTPAPTAEQRLDALESTSDDIILMMADLIGGGE